jgi:hypothetical protein
MALDLAQKLRLTAAALGCSALKDLAREFRRANPATSFDVEPAYKWLQGRSSPRSAQIYTDWVGLLDIAHPAEWLQRCSVEALAEAICDRHGLDRESLMLSAARFGRTPSPGGQEAADTYLTGVYACYSMAWSPYYAGRLIRGTLVVSTIPPGRRIVADYSENLPTGPYRARGSVVLGRRSLHLSLAEHNGGEPLHFSLMRPARPASLLLGILSGVTLLAPEPLPSVSRVAMVRVTEPVEVVERSNRYLEPTTTLTDDLRPLGLRPGDPAAMDGLLGGFLTMPGKGGWDQVPGNVAAELIAMFDQLWFEQRADALL